jgi:hypothetical protein
MAVRVLEQIGPDCASAAIGLHHGARTSVRAPRGTKRSQTATNGAPRATTGACRSAGHTGPPRR